MISALLVSHSAVKRLDGWTDMSGGPVLKLKYVNFLKYILVKICSITNLNVLRRCQSLLWHTLTEQLSGEEKGMSLVHMYETWQVWTKNGWLWHPGWTDFEFHATARFPKAAHGSFKWFVWESQSSVKRPLMPTKTPKMSSKRREMTTETENNHKETKDPQRDRNNAETQNNCKNWNNCKVTKTGLFYWILAVFADVWFCSARWQQNP